MFFSVLTVAAFTGCSKDDSDDGGNVMPSITVNGGNSALLIVGYAGGNTSAVEVVSSGDWTLSITSGDGSACQASPASGKAGTTSVSFNVSGGVSTDRTFVATLTTTGKIAGYEHPVSAKILIDQTNALYKEICGTDVDRIEGDKYWPYTDQFEGWSRSGLLNQSGVTYSGYSSNVADSGDKYEPSEAETSVSGAPYVFINKNTGKYYINNINIGTNTNFTFTFNAFLQTSYSSETGPTAGSPADAIDVSVSTNGGTSYIPVTFTAEPIVTGGNWYVCTAMFRLPEGTSTDKISIGFENYPYSDTQKYGLRMDDFKLVEGGTGDELEMPDASEKTIKEIQDADEAGIYEVKGATVVGASERGFVISDGTGYMFVFKYDSKNPVPLPKVGNTVTVSGQVKKSNTNLQFDQPDFTITAEGTSYTYPSPTLVTADNIATIAAGTPQYVKVSSSKLFKDNTYYNFNFAGISNYSGSVHYPNADFIAPYLDTAVDMEGWYLYTASSRYFYIMVTKFGESDTPMASFTTQPKTFAATDPVAQDLTFTMNNVETVEFEITGDNKDMFTHEYTSGTTVTVKAVGNNTSDAAYTATLNLKGGDVVLASVTLKQSAPSTGAEGAPYTWNLIDGNGGMNQNGGTTTEVGTPGMIWTYDSAGYLSTASDGSKDLQIGSSKALVENWSIYTEEYTGEISKIVVNARTGGTATLSVKIGDTVIGEESLVSTAEDYIFEPVSPMSGKVTIILSASTKKAMYLKSIAINPAE